MSFSFIIKEEDISSTLSAAIDEKVEAIPNPNAKQEALALCGSIPEVVSALNGDKEFSSVSISGSTSTGAASLSVHVTYKQVPVPSEDAVVEEEVAPKHPESIDTSDQGKPAKPDNPKKP